MDGSWDGEEGGDTTAEGAGESDSFLEGLLLSKNRKLEHELTQAKLSLQELTVQVCALTMPIGSSGPFKGPHFIKPPPPI
eukprot:1195392-Prorocentrum_minimum.AAC.3